MHVCWGLDRAEGAAGEEAGGVEWEGEAVREREEERAGREELPQARGECAFVRSAEKK